MRVDFLAILFAFFFRLFSADDLDGLHALQVFQLGHESAEFTLHFICFDGDCHVRDAIDGNGLVDGQDVCAFCGNAVEHCGKEPGVSSRLAAMVTVFPLVFS